MTINTRRGLERYIAGQRNAVGGPYGQPHFNRQFDPPAGVDPFVDSVVIKRETPSTKHYISTGLSANFNAIDSFPAVLDAREEVFYVWQGAVDSVVFISMALHTNQINETTIRRVDALPNLNAALYINLIKTADIQDSTKALFYQNLTWNNSHYEHGGTTHGTLYDTPANFEDNGALGYKLAEKGMSSGSGSGSGIVTYSRRDLFNVNHAMNFGPYAAAAGNSGPYFGIHIWYGDGDGAAPNGNFDFTGFNDGFNVKTTFGGNVANSLTESFSIGLILA